MPVAAIALGSNLGAREDTLLSAIRALGSAGSIVATSSFHETEPVGYTNQPNFLNGAVLLQTDLPPEELLRSLLAIEVQHGRDRSHGIAKGPRVLDLDLLLYDDAVFRTDSLTLPHPEMHHRAFVLRPLAEIAPGMLHPVLRRTVTQMLEDVTSAP